MSLKLQARVDEIEERVMVLEAAMNLKALNEKKNEKSLTYGNGLSGALQV